MGKRIVSQRRGRGTLRYLSPSHRYVGEIKFKKYDETEKNNVNEARVTNIIHCPGHSAPLMMVKYNSGEDLLMPAPENVYVNKVIFSGLLAVIEKGNITPLKNIPEGTEICSIEITPGSGPVFCRSSGTFAIVVSKTKDKIGIKFPSSKVKELSPECRAMIGVVSGGGRPDKPFVKAGNKWHAMKARNRLYPITSPVAMNATDHPFGSGRGRHKGRCSVPPRHAPPGRNVGLIGARRTGRKR